MRCCLIRAMFLHANRKDSLAYRYDRKMYLANNYSAGSYIHVCCGFKSMLMRLIRKINNDPAFKEQ